MPGQVIDGRSVRRDGYLVKSLPGDWLRRFKRSSVIVEDTCLLDYYSV